MTSSSSRTIADYFITGDNSSSVEIVAVSPKRNDSQTEISSIPQQKKEIQQLVNESSPRVSFRKKEIKGRTKSSIWIQFEEVLVDSIITNFVHCAKCHTIYCYDSKKGNNTLLRHLNFCGSHKNLSEDQAPCTKTSVQTKATAYFSNSFIPKSAKEELNNTVVIGLAKDLRPLNAIEGTGLRHIFQAMVNFGAIYGRQDIGDLLNHRTTLRQECLPRIMVKERRIIQESILGAPQHPSYAFTTDMWTEKHNSRCYISLSIHFIDKTWSLQTFLLGVEEFIPEKKSTENVRSECDRILLRYFKPDQVSTINTSSWIVTDGGSNLRNAFANRLDCQCHRLNLVVKWMFNKATPTQEEILNRAQQGNPYSAKHLFNFGVKCPDFQGALQGVKELVTFFKKSELNCLLKIRLKQAVSTRWNSELIMLKSFLTSMQEMKEILVKKNKNDELQKLVSIKESAVRALITFLTPFMDCTEVFSSEKTCTVHLVLPWWHKLIALMQLSEEDSEELQNLKAQAAVVLEEYKVTHLDYFVASFLDPRLKKLKFATERQKQKTHEVIKIFMSDAARKSIPVEGISELEDGVSVGPPAKKSRLQEYMDSSSDEESGTNDDTVNRKVEDEFLHYSRLKLTADERNKDILQFWCGATNFPLLKQVAQRFLSIPASQTTDERVFSSTGKTATPVRTTLSASTLSDLTFLHKNTLRK